MFYINGINGGGAARVMIQLAMRFSSIGYRTILVTSFLGRGDYPFPAGVERITLEQEEVAQSKLIRNISRIYKLRKLCRYHKPLALISFMAEPNFRAILAAMFLPVKTIISVRNDPRKEYGGFINYLVAQFLLPMADGCVFQTEQASSWFPSKLRIKSRVILNEVMEIFYNIDRSPGKDIVSIGRLTPQKNHKLLIRAFARISENYPDYKLKIYGVGELEGDLLKEIIQHNLEGAVIMMGSTDDVPVVLSTAALFVLPSDYEGMPNALMEALAAGVPSISTNCPCGGPEALIQNGSNGLLVPVGDEVKMAEAIELLVSNPCYAELLGNNAKELAEFYHPDVIFKHWKHYVESVIHS